MKVGIIGAGTMGSGIAQAFAQTEGYEVMLCDINETFAANGKKKIHCRSNRIWRKHIIRSH
jgi:3-hydroxybutyryl-CoA dehydrogenase